MMTTTMTLATNLHVSPFELFAQDCDEVIMLINYYLILSEHPQETKAAKAMPKTAGKEQRIRVNDKTATNGWF